MRDYKFRGWDAVGKKGWVFGDLVHNKKVTKTGLEDRVMVAGYEVVPESVGILLCTAKGEEYYDGDLIKVGDFTTEYIVKMDDDGMIRAYLNGSDKWVNFHTILETFRLKTIGTAFNPLVYERRREDAQSEQ